METGAHPDFTHAQPRHQHLAHEILRGHRRQRRVEPQQADAIAAQRAQPFQLGPRQHQPRRRRASGEQFARQRLERQRHRRYAQRARASDRVADQRAMALVQAVKRTDADHASLGAQRPASGIAEQEGHDDPPV